VAKINLSLQSGAGVEKIKEAIPLPYQMGVGKKSFILSIKTNV
jgi:hypothetical protein